MEYVTLPAREIKAISGKEIVVVGGGVAGFSAAIAAARSGGKAVLIDEGAMLGGTTTKSLMMTWSANYSGVGGFFAEICRKLEQAQGHPAPFDPETMELLAFDLIEKEGVQLLLHTTVVDVLKEDNRLKGVIASNKSGIQAILGDIFVDATGDGDLAAMAGEAHALVDDNERQPMTLMFSLGGVDIGKFAAFVSGYPDRSEFGIQGRPLPPNVQELIEKRLISSVSGFYAMVKRARDAGELRVNHDHLVVQFLRAKGSVVINATQVGGLSPVNGEQKTIAEIEARRQMMSIYSFLRGEIPGFEGSFITGSASQIGVRESRRILAEYTLTRDDVISGTHFEDAVMVKPPGNLSIHGPGESQTWMPVDHPVYVPYRSLLAKKCENLLLAGRCVSADHIGHAAVRNVSGCFATGQAAGTAAALALTQRVTPKRLSVRLLQESLVKQGVLLPVAPL